MQEDDGASIGPLWVEKAMDERQIPLLASFLAGHGKLRHHDFQILRPIFVVRGNQKRLAQMRGRFVHREARTVRGELEQRAAGFAHVEGTEVFSVVEGRR